MKRVAIASIVLLLFLAAGYQAYRNLETYQDQIELPGSAAARHNPLLAAERVLWKLKQPAQARRGSRLLTHLPPVSDTLLVYQGATPLGPERVAPLLRWVAGGGHLVMDVDRLYDPFTKQARSPLLAALGLNIKDTKESGTQTFAVHFRHDDQLLKIKFLKRYRLYSRTKQPLQGIGDKHGLVLAQVHHGAGLVTLVNDLQPFDNRHIGEPDHAYLLYRLVGGRHKVWLLYDPYTPSLADLLWHHAAWVLSSLLLAGVLWLWRGNLRPGPLREPSGAQRRDLFEHLDAQGGFDWRHGLAPMRYRATQREVYSRWLARYPAWQALDRASCCARIAEHVGRDPDEVSQALFEAYADQPDFIQRSRLLQALWHTV